MRACTCPVRIPAHHLPVRQVFYNELVQHTDTGAAVGDPVATFEGAAVLAPRGRFSIELYLSFLKLTGQASSPVSATLTLPVFPEGSCANM